MARRIGFIAVGAIILVAGVVLTIEDVGWGPAVALGGLVMLVFSWPRFPDDEEQGPGWDGIGPGTYT